mgnify:FL=1
MKITFALNGTVREMDVHPLDRLLDLLRGKAGLTGTKEGCGEGECGACAVLLDGELVNSCMVPAIQVHGRDVLTVEGLGTSKNPDPLQRAFAEEGAVQCGFCIPGMVLASRALLQNVSRPSRKEIRTALSGNLCRCTGYEKIFRAVEKAASWGYGEQCGRKLLFIDSSPVFSPGEKDFFFQPLLVEEALALRDRFGDEALFLGGATDFYPDLKNGRVTPKRVIDLSRIGMLKEIRRERESLFVGSMATDTAIMKNSSLAAFFPALAKAAELSGAPAVQNRATLGGNLASASGAADLPVPLLVLGARVLAGNTGGERAVPIEDFFTGYRKTALAKNELLLGVQLPMGDDPVPQAFYKRGSRAALTLSRASIAASAEVKSGILRSVRAASGSMTAYPSRMPVTEAFLEGKSLSGALIDEAAACASEEIVPRTSAAFRKAVSGNLVKKFLLYLQGEERRQNLH